jgi:hypothetical protein
MKISKSSLFKTFLLKIDQFGIKPELNYNNSIKFKTKVGGAISLLFFITIAMGIIYFGKELFNKEHPSLIQANIYDQDPGRFNLTGDAFRFFVGIEDINFNYYIDPSIYTIAASLPIITRSMDPNGQPVFDYNNFIPLRVEQCKLNVHFANFKDQFDNQPLSSLLCINPNDADKTYLRGSFGEIEYAYLSIKLSSCRNGTTHGVICKPQEEIDHMLNGGYVAVNFIDTLFDPSKFETPYKYSRKNFFTTFSKKYYKEWTFYFNNVDYYTDAGLLMEDKDLSNYLIFEKTYELLDLREEDNFLNIAIRLSNTRNVYNRKYMKLQDFLAQMGGLVNGLDIILKLILTSYGLNNYFRSMINCLFILSEDKPKQKTANLSSNFQMLTPDKLIIGRQQMGTLKDEVVGEESSQRITEDKLKHITANKKKLKLRLKCCDNLKVMLCCCTKQTGRDIIFFKKGKERINSNTDIVKMNRVFEEFDLIKSILFDGNSSILLHYLMEYKVLKMNEQIGNEQIPSINVIKSYMGLKDNHVNNSLRSIFENNVISLYKTS